MLRNIIMGGWFNFVVLWMEGWMSGGLCSAVVL